MASSPAFRPAAKAAACSAAVPELKLTACLAPSPGGKGFLKLGDPRARGQPVGAQGLDHRLNVGFINRLVPVRQESLPDRRSAVDGQHFTACRSYGHHW